jgi:hypothetical protein
MDGGLSAEDGQTVEVECTLERSVVGKTHECASASGFSVVTANANVDGLGEDIQNVIGDCTRRDPRKKGCVAFGPPSSGIQAQLTPGKHWRISSKARFGVSSALELNKPKTARPTNLAVRMRLMAHSRFFDLAICTEAVQNIVRRRIKREIRNKESAGDHFGRIGHE